MALLKTAGKVYAGATAAKAIYQGGVKVWPAYVTPTLVQTVNGKTTVNLTLTLTLPQATVAGRTLLWVSNQFDDTGQNSIVASITDNGGNVWQKLYADSYAQPSSANKFWGEIWACFNAKSMTQVTATSGIIAGYSPIIRGSISEYSGTTNLQGAIVTAKRTGSGTGLSSGTLSATGPGLVVSGVSAWTASSFGTSPAAPWTSLYKMAESQFSGAAATRVVTPELAGPAVAGATWTINASRYSIGITVGPAAP